MLLIEDAVKRLPLACVHLTSSTDAACVPLRGRQAVLHAGVVSALLTLLLLSGCADTQSAAGDTARYLWASKASLQVPPPELRPDRRYLRVTANGYVAWMVLGYVDQDRDGEAVEVWYSADREVLRLQHGRLVGVNGTPVRWEHVQWRPARPSWPEGAAVGQWQRVVDEREAHIERAGLQRDLQVRAIQPPGDSELAGIAPEQLRWYEARTTQDRLPAARYALAPSSPTPAYGEQCVTQRMCLTWQYWPPRP